MALRVVRVLVHPGGSATVPSVTAALGTQPPLLTLPHETTFLEGRLVGRFDRFIADVELEDGAVVQTHCVNPGRMEGLVIPGARAWVSKAPPERKRKLKYTLELIEVGGCLVGANTAIPNTIAKAILQARILRGLSRFDELQAERRYGTNSRVDFWLRSGRKEHFVEVKNCHLVYPDGRGYFPDSVSERATKHLRELMEVREQGHKASVLFTAQDPNATALRPSDVHDPAFARTVREAQAKGVRFFAVRVRPTTEAYIVEASIPVDTKPYRTERMARWKAERDGTSGWKRRVMKSR